MHNIHVLISRRVDAEGDQQLFEHSVILDRPQGFVLIPVTGTFYRSKFNPNSLPKVIETFEFLTPEFLEWLRQMSRGKKIAYCETDYFGGAGGQGALVLSDGQVIFGPKYGDEAYINQALSVLGVTTDGKQDEFDALGLGDYRSTDRWLRSATKTASPLGIPHVMAHMNRRLVSTATIWASIAAYCASLATPASVTAYYGKWMPHYGAEALLLGPIGFFAGHFSWVANVFLVASWFTRTRPDTSPSFFWALLAIGAALTFLLGKTIDVGSAGDFKYHAQVGYYLWLASMSLAAVSALTFGQPNRIQKVEAGAP